MWTDYITSISHVLKVNEYGERQAKGNEKNLCFTGWETLVIIIYRQIVVKITLKGKKYSHFPWKSSNFVADKPMLDKLTINAR